MSPAATTARPIAPAWQSKFFYLSEFTTSQTAARLGINNTPNAAVIANLNWLCLKILDPLRTKLAKPIVISSGYRSVTLNQKIGGAGNSQHCLGQAADITVPGMPVDALFKFIINQTKLPFDQIIQEFGQWVHISFDHNLTAQRGQKLLAKNVNGQTVYSKFTG